jgi:hypothetical protein
MVEKEFESGYGGGSSLGGLQPDGRKVLEETEAEPQVRYQDFLCLKLVDDRLEDRFQMRLVIWEPKYTLQISLL